MEKIKGLGRDRIELGTDDGAVILRVYSPEFRDMLGMAATPAAARQIAAALVRLADEADAQAGAAA